VVCASASVIAADLPLAVYFGSTTISFYAGHYRGLFSYSSFLRISQFCPRPLPSKNQEVITTTTIYTSTL
jgi:hypothetical protein